MGVGKPILYCGDCGRSLREEDFERLRAGYLQNSPYCVRCCPNVVLTTPPAPKQAAPFPSSTRVRAIPVSTPARSLRAGSSKTLPATFAAAIGGALVVLAIAAALSSSRKPAPERNPAPVARAPQPETRPEPEPPPRPRPVIPSPEPPPPPPPPQTSAAVLDRYLDDIRAIRDQDKAFKRADEIRSMLRRAAEIAGPRKADVLALLDDYEKALAGPPPSPPTPAKPLGQVASFTLVDADTEKPVPGFDPIVPEATLDLGKLKLKKIDVVIQTSPKEVGSVETVIDKEKARGENSWPYSFTTNSVKDGFTGWTPTAGRHTLKCRVWSESNRKGQAGPWVIFNFTVVDPR